MYKEIVRKEAKLVLRASNGILSMGVLMLALTVIFHYTLETRRSLTLVEISGLKWATIFLLSFVFIGQSNWEEREGGANRINRILLPPFCSLYNQINLYLECYLVPGSFFIIIFYIFL